MKVQLSKLITVCCFLLLGLTTSYAQLDCDCDFSIDPVCVTLDNGEVLTFLNPCLAACEGYGDDAITSCDGNGWPGDDCDCPDDVYDPVCVLTAGGIICPFSNMCEAECAGYTDADVVPCESDCNCPDVYDPVCIVSPDGINFEFPNACWAECAGYNDDEIVACEDPCNCPDVWDPVCVVTDDGIFYQFGNLCEAECQGFSEDQVVECENDCPCTEEYNPVCVVTDDGILLEFQNPCFAACEGFGPDQFVDCTDPCICTDEWDPVCVISPNGDIIQFGNPCEAGCEGYGPDQFIDCENGSDCSVLIIATQIDDEGFVWAFGSIATGDVDAYFWDFGDGNTSTEGSPVHTYTTPGLYFVTLTITTADGCIATTTHILYAGNCYNIIIAIPSGNYTYAFGAIATGTPVSWYWEFGDGATSSEGAPVHTYPGPGTYEVSLTTVHEDSCVWTSTTIIEIEDDCVCPDIYDPVCVISPDGEVIEFSNSCEAACAGYGPDTWFDCNNEDCTVEIFSIQEDDEGFVWAFQAIVNNNNVIEYFWEFGDGNTSAEMNPVHTYTTPGLYLVSLTIITADGCTATATQWLYAGNCYNIIIAIPSGDMTYAFGSIANSAVLSYFWEFGDGSTSTEGSPVHTYAEPGSYDVSLTTVHEDLCVWTSTITIEIIDDCICTDEWDPVCVISTNGDIIQFGNSCEAECAGYGPDAWMECENDCPCPDVWDPVCVVGPNGDIIQYGNSCEAACAGYGPDTWMECENDCICTDEWDPVCVVDGDIVIIFSNLCEAECAGYGPDQIIDCDGDCNCTEEYNPVCVVLDDGTIFEFPNPCHAECAGYGPDTWINCENDCNCPDEWDPVCVVTDFGEFYMFSNLCEAECHGFGPDDVVSCEPDCGCDEVWDPVCVTLDDGVTIEFSNACWAECAGFTAGDYVECDGVMDDGPVDEAPILHVIFGYDGSDLTDSDLPEFFQDMMDANGTLIETASVYPNPSTGDEIRLELKVQEETTALISIVSLRGELIQVMESDLVKGTQELRLDTEKLIPGIYFTKIETAKGTYTVKFIRQ